MQCDQGQAKRREQGEASPTAGQAMWTAGSTTGHARSTTGQVPTTVLTMGHATTGHAMLTAGETPTTGQAMRPAEAVAVAHGAVGRGAARRVTGKLATV